ncbi:MAG: PqqD family protein [Legionellales bacterium]|nr:PqqD family protein [Legionellales bacterium]
MQTCSEITLLQLNPDIVYTVIDDDTVIMRPQDDYVFGANAIATDIWRLLASQTMSILTITTYILEHYEVEETRCFTDIKAFIGSLIEENFVCIVQPT